MSTKDQLTPSVAEALDIFHRVAGRDDDPAEALAAIGVLRNALAQQAQEQHNTGPEFTVADPDLDNLLNLAASLVKGNANHDTGMAWLSALEAVESRMTTQQAQKPVGEIMRSFSDCSGLNVHLYGNLTSDTPGIVGTKLYTTPQPQPAPPAGEVTDGVIGDALGQPAYHNGFGKHPDLWNFEQIAQAVRAILAMRPQAVPMTPEQIRSMCKQQWVFETVRQWVRIIEAHHGITAKAEGEKP